MRRPVSRALVHGRDRGASAVEYGLMIAAIAALIVGVVFGLTETFTNSYHDTCTELEQHNQLGDLANPDSDAC